jgi:hypothetical protein
MKYDKVPEEGIISVSPLEMLVAEVHGCRTIENSYSRQYEHVDPINQITSGY